MKILGLVLLAVVFVQAKPLEREKRDLKELAEQGIALAAAEAVQRFNAPIGNQNSYKYEIGGKELDVNYGATLNDQIRKRRSPQGPPQGSHPPPPPGQGGRGGQGPGKNGGPGKQDNKNGGSGGGGGGNGGNDGNSDGNNGQQQQQG